LIFRVSVHRFCFQAIDSVCFPTDKAGNVLRGALLTALQLDAAPQKRPSGLADPPAPFVLRAAHLNGMCFEPGEAFVLELNLFDLRPPLAERIAAVISGWEKSGLGPRRGRVRLLTSEFASEPVAIDLSQPIRASQCSVEFRTPTELKGPPETGEIPFAILFARVRDRISTLSSLYGEGSPAIDFRAMGTRAALVRTTRANLHFREVERRSSRTGQTHGIGGVTGSVDYEGDLAEFIPWLRAACWTGVGRHTVWGNGAIDVVVSG
jgi:hypothetical protein